MIGLMQKALFELDLPSAKAKTSFQRVLDSLRVTEGPAWPDRFGKAIRNWIYKYKTKPIRTLSLFSGGGGLDIAFHDCGFDIAEMIEVEPKYVETLRANSQKGKMLEGSKVICTDIRDYEPSSHLGVDFIIGGPPCQTFSAAGRRAAGVLGTDDPRGTLFAEYARLLRQLQPIGFLFENVYGITGAQDGKAWEEVQAAFNSVGYTIHFRVLDAADYGVPQHRERLFIVGTKEGGYLFPYPTHGPDSIGQNPFYKAGEAVSGVDKTGTVKEIGGKYGHLLNDIPPGLNYSFYTKEMGHPKPVFSWRTKFSDFLYKADPDSPVRTVKAQGGQYTGPFSWENRFFTIAELKRLQTIPDEYDITGGRQVVIEQIGNSVPPQIGRILALSILDQILKIEIPFPMHYMPKNKELGFRRRKRLLTKLYAAKAKAAIERLPQQSKQDTGQEISIVKKNDVRYISPIFSWSDVEIPNSIALKLNYRLTEDSWDISAGLNPIENKLAAYEISIFPSTQNDWCLGKRKVNLRALDLNTTVFTGLWKAFEEEVSKVFGIADLVQLSGYYQYKPRIIAQLEFSDLVCPNDLWQVIQSVVKGVGVGRQMSGEQLAFLWSVNVQNVLNHLKALREIGYEVRSHTTNLQIQQGEYLIPYIFPTLTPKSVQLHKSLDDGSK